MRHALSSIVTVLAGVFFLLIVAGSAALGSPMYTFVDLQPSDSSYRSDVSEADGGGTGQQVGTVFTSGMVAAAHAALWNGSAQSFIDLNPTPDGGSKAFAANAGRQVGYAAFGPTQAHAALWTGTAQSAVDLNPPGAPTSQARGVSGNQIVGTAQGVGAVIWDATTGTVASVLGTGIAYATDGSHQVGEVGAINFDSHALLWSGTAASEVDLHPAGWQSSEAFGVWGGQQVGYAAGGGVAHAMLWNGTAASAIDLNPLGYSESRATAVFNGIQVGWGIDANGSGHALLWEGSAASVVDLNAYLPPGYSSAGAYGLDEEGNILGVASDAAGTHAAVWLAPEPGGMWLLAMVGFVALRCRARRS